MAELNNNSLQDSSLVVTLSVGQLKELVRGEVRALVGAGHAEDRLLDVEEAANLLNTDEDWLYRNHKKLPFTRKLAPKLLRFSHQGIMKWISSRKNS